MKSAISSCFDSLLSCISVQVWMDEATCTSEKLSPEEDKLAYACKPQNSVQNGNDELSNKAANFGADLLSSWETPVSTLNALASGSYLFPRCCRHLKARIYF